VSEHVSVTTDAEGVATVRLDHPPVNALRQPVWAQLHAVARDLAVDRTATSVVLWGGPTVFAAGADVAELAGVAEHEPDAAAPLARSVQDAVRAWAGLPQVVVAAIDGYALGAGCELALAADFRVAATNAQLGLPEVTLGLLPGAGGTQRLPRLIGLTRAKEMIYSGDFYDAHACQAMGLVDAVVDPEETLEAARSLARRYARAPVALALAKQAIDQGAGGDLEAGLARESRLFAAACATQDARIGLRSHLDAGPGQATFVRR